MGNIILLQRISKFWIPALILIVLIIPSCILSEDPIQHDNRFFATWKLDTLQTDSSLLGKEVTFNKHGTFAYMEKRGYTILDAKWKTKAGTLILDLYLGIQQNGTWNEKYEYQYKFNPDQDTVSLFQKDILKMKYFKI